MESYARPDMYYAKNLPLASLHLFVQDTLNVCVGVAWLHLFDSAAYAVRRENYMTGEYGTGLNELDISHVVAKICESQGIREKSPTEGKFLLDKPIRCSLN